MNCIKCSTELTRDDFRSISHRPIVREGIRQDSGLCKKCYKTKTHTAASANWRANNPERDREIKRDSAKRRRKENPEIFNEASAKYRKAHPDEIKERSKRRTWKRSKADEKAARERFIAKHGREYYNAQVLQGIHRRRAKLRGSKFDTVAWELLKQEFDFTCLWCQRREPEILLTPDHVVPVSKGGADTIDNIQPLCLQCNQKKNARTWDFRRVSVTS